MKRLVLVLAVFVLVAAPMIAGIWTLITPQYQARAEIRVRPVIPRLVFATEDNGVIPFYDSFVNTQVSLIRTPIVLQRVLDMREVQATQWYKNPAKTLLQRLAGDAVGPLERLQDGLCAQPRPRTEIIEVSFTDVRADDARIIVDAVLDQYLKYYTDTSGAMDDKLYRQLVDQYKSLENEIQGREKILAELHKLLGTETPQELIAGRGIRIDETEARLSDLQSRMAVLEWESKRMERNDSNGVSIAAADSAEHKPRYHVDEEWRRLDISARTIRHNIAVSSLDPNNLGAIRAHKDLEFAEELRQVREKQLDEQWSDRVRNVSGLAATTGEGAVTVEYQLARAKVEEQLLRADLERQQRDFKELFDTAQLLEKENAGLRHKRELFDAVRQRLDQKNMERNVSGSIEIAMRADSPSKPADHRVTFTAGALLLALCVASGAAFLTRRTTQIMERT